MRAGALPIKVGGPAGSSSLDLADEFPVNPAPEGADGPVIDPFDPLDPVVAAPASAPPTRRGRVIDEDWADAEFPPFAAGEFPGSTDGRARATDFRAVCGDDGLGGVVVLEEFAGLFAGAVVSSTGDRAPFTVSELS